MDVNEVIKDPDFLGLPLEEQRKVMTQVDPDFAGLPSGEQDKVLVSFTPNKPSVASSLGEVAEQSLGPIGFTSKLASLPSEPRREALETAGTVIGGVAGQGMASIPAAGAGKLAASKVADALDAVENPENVKAISSFLADPVNGMRSKIVDMAQKGLNRDQILAAVGEEVGKSGLKFSQGALEQAFALLTGFTGSKAIELGKKGAIRASKFLAENAAKVPKFLVEHFANNAEAVSKATGTPESVEQAVKGVKNLVRDTKMAAQKEYGETLRKLGVNKTDDELLSGLESGAFKAQAPEKLAKDLTDLQWRASKLPQEEFFKEASSLRAQMNHALGDAAGEEAKALGVAKDQLDQLILQRGGEPILAAAKQYGEKINVVKALEDNLNNERGHFDIGKATEYLRKVFGSGRESFQDVIDTLDLLEKQTGSAAVTQLKNELAKQAMSKLIGRPTIATGSLGFALSQVATGMPPIGPAAFLAMQSPVVYKGAIKAAQAVPEVAAKNITPAASGLAATIAAKRRKSRENSNGTK